MTSGSSWTWLLCGGYGQVLCELTTATGRQLSFARNTWAEARCTVSVDDEAAVLIANELQTGWPRLRCYRRADGALTSTLVFNGFFAPIVETAEIGSTLQIVARSPFARLGDGPGSGWPLAAQTFTATDAGAIAASIINEANLEGLHGLLAGSIEPTKLRDISYPLGQSAGEAVTNLSAMLDGFDFVERYVHEEMQAPGLPVAPQTTLAYLDISARLGTDKPGARFEYGEDTLANLRAVSRTTAAPVNCVQLTGADGLSSWQTDPDSIATYGPWPLTRSFPSISSQATLDDRARAFLRPSPIRTVTMTPDPTAPRPFDDFYLGDTCPLHIGRGSMQENLNVRVNAFTVLVDDDGIEAAEIPDPRTPDEEAAIRASIEVEVVAA